MDIIKPETLGFCSGVRRAITLITAAARKNDGIETLGALVHNSQVIEKLRQMNINPVQDVASARGRIIAISAHGASPVIFTEIKDRGLDVLDTTCPFVRRAQKAAENLSAAGFFTLIFGEAEHPEVKGILGWAGDKGMATLDADSLKKLPEIPRRTGLVSQTTQVPSDFSEFCSAFITTGFRRDAEVRIVDTICHETRERQAETIRMAKRSDAVIVVGGRNSANTRRLYKLCSSIIATYWIETSSEIEPEWLKGRQTVGVTAGTSTDDDTIDDVLRSLDMTSQG
jgi:4-hydroxy-3-methylbut-2-enyl diphosphate reductase